MQENLIKYILGRTKRTLLLPFYKYIYKLKKSTNLKVMFSKALVFISSALKNFLSLRPKKSTDYIYMGRIGIYKKLLIVLLLLICLLPIAYFEFFSSPVSSVSGLSKYEFCYNDSLLEAFSGTARILSKDGHLVYEGSIEKGKCTGKGKLYNHDGSPVYTGDFKDNQYSGNGELFYANGKLKYSGMFEVNQYNGKGTLYSTSNAVIYSGEFKSDEYNGNGTLYYPDGNLKYTGTFEAGLYNGEGILYNTNNTIQYSGSFVKGKKHGKGKLFDSTGQMLLYEGNFFEDTYSDEGSAYADKNTLLYTGSFKDGLYSGEGTLFDPNTTRTKYKGEFKDGVFDGNGILYSDAGRNMFAGQFLKGSIDYVYFLNLPTSELSKHFFSPPVVNSPESAAYMSYEDMNVTFVIKGIDTEALEQEQSSPTVKSVVVYDGTLPSIINNQAADTDIEDLLGAPVYDGYTYLLSEDLIALKGLKHTGVLTEKDELYSAIYDTDINSDIISETDNTDISYSDTEIYVKCYEYLDFSLSLFYDKKDGKFLYYAWDID